MLTEPEHIEIHVTCYHHHMYTTGLALLRTALHTQDQRQIKVRLFLVCLATTVLFAVDWDSKLNGGQLCLYHKPTGDQGKACGDQGQACGDQATVVAPAGDTLVIFDSHMEHEVFPSFADRCPNLQTVSQHLPSIETSIAATSTLPALQL